MRILFRQYNAFTSNNLDELMNYYVTKISDKYENIFQFVDRIFNRKYLRMIGLGNYLIFCGMYYKDILRVIFKKALEFNSYKRIEIVNPNILINNQIHVKFDEKFNYTNLETMLRKDLKNDETLLYFPTSWDLLEKDPINGIKLFNNFKFSVLLSLKTSYPGIVVYKVNLEFILKNLVNLKDNDWREYVFNNLPFCNGITSLPIVSNPNRILKKSYINELKLDDTILYQLIFDGPKIVDELKAKKMCNIFLESNTQINIY